MTAFRILRILLIAYVGLLLFVYFWQRALLFHPSHSNPATDLSPWKDEDRTIGSCREVANPRTIWLMMHGNAGQAADRDYVLPCLPEEDALYVLEYPGYGARGGKPTMESMNQAAREAFRILRAQHPMIPIGVIGESIGSGPACILAGEPTPPEKIVLLVPFDVLASVASHHFPYLPVRLMLCDQWDNVEALKSYRGPVEIFGANDDTIIPIRHARALAEQLTGARFTAIAGGHNDWADNTQVSIRR